MLRPTIVVLLPLLLLALPRTCQTRENPFSGFTAADWPQADRLFRSDPLWLGGDGAYSVDLGHGRVLWLFGDSFIATAPGETRRQSTFVHNSIAIERGYDPAHASMTFYWSVKKGKPTEFAANEGKVWLWPDDSLRIGDKLLLFFSRVRSDNSKNSLGWQSAGWTAFLVENPDSEPSSWILHRANTGSNKLHIDLGEGTERLGDFVYAFGSQEGPRPGDFLARWPVPAAEAGNLSSPEWWCGSKYGWLAQEKLHKQAPVVVIPNASSEFAIQWRPRLHKFVEVESVGFGASHIAIRSADRLEGPWSLTTNIYHPPESNRPDAFVYAGKLHPGLIGADVVITYVANSMKDRVLAVDTSIYYPRFVRLNFSRR